MHPLPPQRAMTDVLTPVQARSFTRRWAEAGEEGQHIQPLTTHVMAALTAYGVADMEPTGEEPSAPLFPNTRPRKKGTQELARELRAKIKVLHEFEERVQDIQEQRPDDTYNYNLRVQQVVGMRHAIMTTRALVKKCSLREGREIPPWDSAAWSDPNATF